MKDSRLGRAILFSEMVPQASFKEKFSAWHDAEYLPSRMNCSGLVSGQSYRADTTDSLLTVLEAKDRGSFGSPELKHIETQQSEMRGSMLSSDRGFSRYIGEEIYRNDPTVSNAEESPLLFAVWWRVPPDREPEFGDWYEQEHVPLLTSCPDWRMVRRFRVTDGQPEAWNHLALHYLGSKSALQSPEREAARKTVWRNKLATEPWFEATYSLFNHAGSRICAPRT
jgi:hypothetical protein